MTTRLTDDIRKKVTQLSIASDDELYAEFGRSLGLGAFETDPEEEGRKRFPHFLKSVRKAICENKQVCALLDVFHLRFVEGLDLSEISRGTGLRENTAKAHLYWALKIVRAGATAHRPVSYGADCAL
jgi:DNA-directed RNA polymerase specialized sigma24 family protein